MICKYCGSHNPDGCTACSTCGGPLGVSVPPVSTPAQTVAAASTQPRAFVVSYETRFRSAWRKVASSGIVLILALVYSVSVILGFVQMEKTMSVLNTLLEMLVLLGGTGASFAQQGGTVLNLCMAAFIVPGVLMAIGLWMTYVDGHNSTEQPLNGSGLKLILCAKIAELGMICLAFGVAILGVCGFLTDGASSDQSAKDAVLGAIVFMLVCWAVLAYIRLIFIKLVTKMRDSANQCSPKADHTTSAAVLCFITGVLMALIMLITGITVSSLINCAAEILFGVVILMYKGLMKKLQSEQLRVG